MSFFKNLFSRKKEALPATPPPLPPPVPPQDPAKDPNLIRVHDAYGREMFITRQQWRDNVLLGNLQKVWDKPDDLYQMILSALNDGFRADVLDAARHLHQIDPDHERGACLWGIVLLEEGRLDLAETVFKNFIAQYGETGAILTNLAKVHSNRGDHAKAEATLWHALELDPNQANGGGWYAAIHRERGGEEAEGAALRQLAQIPGSWRPQLWLARAALQGRDLTGALALYHQALSKVRPVPADALMQISGDLGNAGHLTELLALTAPHFDPSAHGLQVGNNLVKAYLDLGQIDAARAILDQLYALNRPDWKPHLSYWDTEIAKARVAIASPMEPVDLQVTMLTIDGPVWLKRTSPAAELFPAHDADPLRIAFLGCSAEVPTNSQRVERQMADARGRLSRSIPLYLAEQLEFGSNVQAQTLVPWITNDDGGFILAGAAWSDEQAAAPARQGEIKNDYVVSSHLKTGTEPWLAQLRLIRTIDGACVATAESELSPEHPAEGLLALRQHLLRLLSQETDIISRPAPPAYAIPAGNDFPYYLLRLEQLLAVRCGALTAEKGGSFLSGEREILDGNIQQCIAYPQSISVRVLMAQTLWTMKLARPDILPAFKDHVALLQREYPLPEPAQSVIQRILNDAFSA